MRLYYVQSQLGQYSLQKTIRTIYFGLMEYYLSCKTFWCIAGECLLILPGHVWFTYFELSIDFGSPIACSTSLCLLINNTNINEDLCHFLLFPCHHKIIWVSVIWSAVIRTRERMQISLLRTFLICEVFFMWYCFCIILQGRKCFSCE